MRDLIPFDAIVPNMIMFAQVSCLSDEAQLESKNLMGMAAACLGVAMIVLFRACIRDETETYNILHKQHEISSYVTVDSFTVLCKLPT